MSLKMRPDEFNETFYDNLAKKYDKTYHPKNWEREYTTKIEKKFIRKNLVKNGLALEIGVGQGRFTGLLAEQSRKVIAVDISQEMLKIAKERNKNYKNIEFRKSNVLELDKLEEYGKFDVVVFFWLLPHIEDMSKVLYIVKNALKEDGVIIFNLWNKNSIYRNYLVKRNEQMEKQGDVPKYRENGSVYTKYLTFYEMLHLIKSVKLGIYDETCSGFIPFKIYRGLRTLLPLSIITESIGKFFFKSRCYNQLFACKTIGISNTQSE